MLLGGASALFTHRMEHEAGIVPRRVVYES
jgi:hypothetical protein